mmetsp:Transcript_6195/g.8652  ORF Transcript_6195/g.8652 Transcript_6195/m.8652 type:complete len:119 (-) Transcript_6195:876-1232(-)
MDISHVLTIDTEVTPPFPNEYKYLIIEIVDRPDENLKQHFTKAIEFIEEGRSQKGVLVHCGAGLSRSPSVVAAFLMKTFQVKYQEAIDLISRARPYVDPNEGFVQQLLEFEMEVLNVK